MNSSPADRHSVAASDRPTTDAWLRSIEQLIKSNSRRILVIGPADAGKSTYCLSLLQAMESAGRAACVLDADVGQKIIGPPACVTVGCRGPDAAVVCSQICFVGATSPVLGWTRLIACLTPAVAELADQTVIVNTSGLLSGPGQRLKDQKIDVVHPDVLVAIGEDPHLDSILATHPEPVVHRLGSAPVRRRKTAAERAATRRIAFQSYFRGSRAWSIARSAIEVDPDSPGDPLPPRLLVGLSDPAGHDLALAIVADSDPAGDAITLLCPERPTPGLRLKRGRIRLNSDCEESPARSGI